MCKYLNKHIRYEKGKKVSVIVFDLITNEMSYQEAICLLSARLGGEIFNQHNTEHTLTFRGSINTPGRQTQHSTGQKRYDWLLRTSKNTLYDLKLTI